MALRDLVNRNVNLAFNTIGDLAIDVMLMDKSVSDYDFEFNETIDGSTRTATVKAVVINRSKLPESPGLEHIELIMKSADIPDPSVYDSVIMDNIEYSVSTFEDNDYTITMTVVGG